MPIDKNIQRVELQISKSGSSAQEESDYQKHIRDPKIWSNTRHGNIVLEELFENANRIARKNADSYTNNEDARKRYITVHGNCMAVSGQAGVGKTTLTKQLLEKVLEETRFEVDFLFYISLRKVMFNENMGVLKFLLTNLHSSWKHDPALDKIILKQLEKSDKMMIIIDGLDEAAINFEDSCRSASVFDVTSPEIILKNLLDGTMFPKAKKLITSRPRQLLELCEIYRPDFIVDILGLNSDAQKQICQDICDSDWDKVYLYLSQHPELSAQCFIPIICIFTVYSLRQHLTNSDNSFTFASVTNIILYVLENFARLRVLRNKTFELGKLSQLAWEGIRDKKYEFNEDDLLRLKLKKESLDTVLTTGTNENTRLRITHYGKITYFSHLIVQEFFSAAYLMLFAPLSEFKEALFLKNDQTNLEVVKKFLFGLSNDATSKRLLALHQSSDTDKHIFDMKHKSRFFKSFISKVVGTAFPGYWFFKLIFPLFYTIDFFTYQTICLWIFESQQKELAKTFVELTPQHLSVSGNIFPHEVSSLCYVLRTRLQPLTLKFEPPKFVGDSCQRFLENIFNMPEIITVRIDKLYQRFPNFLLRGPIFGECAASRTSFCEKMELSFKKKKKVKRLYCYRACVID